MGTGVYVGGSSSEFTGARSGERCTRAYIERPIPIPGPPLLLGDPWNHVVVARTAHDFEDLGRALANARRACERVRRNAGPILAELTAV
jgi:hypothetical protein